jgi:hypothetical protein
VPDWATPGAPQGETRRLPNLDPNFDEGARVIYMAYAFIVVLVVGMAALFASAPHASLLPVGVIELGLSLFTVYGLVTVHRRLQTVRKANIPIVLVIERDRFVGVLPPFRRRPQGGTLDIPFAAVERVEVGSLGGKEAGPWIPPQSGLTIVGCESPEGTRQVTSPQTHLPRQGALSPSP